MVPTCQGGVYPWENQKIFIVEVVERKVWCFNWICVITVMPKFQFVGKKGQPPQIWTLRCYGWLVRLFLPTARVEAVKRRLHRSLMFLTEQRMDKQCLFPRSRPWDEDSCEKDLWGSILRGNWEGKEGNRDLKGRKRGHAGTWYQGQFQGSNLHLILQGQL